MAISRPCNPAMVCVVSGADVQGFPWGRRHRRGRDRQRGLRLQAVRIHLSRRFLLWGPEGQERQEEDFKKVTLSS